MLPKAMRDRVGLVAGAVEVTVDGTALRIEPIGNDDVIRRGRRLVQPVGSATSAAAPIDDEVVRSLIDADRR